MNREKFFKILIINKIQGYLKNNQIKITNYSGTIDPLFLANRNFANDKNFCNFCS